MPVAIRRALIAATAVCIALFGLMVPTASADKWIPWRNCAEGDICVYNGPDGTGEVCTWDGNDANWRTSTGSGSHRWICKWTQTWEPAPEHGRKVKSIWNRGTTAGGPADVRFYFGENYTNYYACAAKGFKGNTGPDAGVFLLSHSWVSSC
ncbi:peptidase inhibitor family I36 protein [Streptomyces sp. NPDC004111]|uniref:peptidase inhibitor family I36 protein n=1 Tax=Streptomyces sp. NPDC004111 TaxID=3364690 RepID=UPI0036A3007D